MNLRNVLSQSQICWSQRYINDGKVGKKEQGPNYCAFVRSRQYQLPSPHRQLGTNILTSSNEMIRGMAKGMPKINVEGSFLIPPRSLFVQTNQG